MRKTIAVAWLILGCAIVAGQEPAPTGWQLKFEGNRIFSDKELADITNQCLKQYKPTTAPAPDAVEYCLWRLTVLMGQKGYLRAKVAESRREQTDTGLRITVSVEEGIRYRLGDVQVNGAKLFTSQHLLATLKLKAGDIANGEELSAWAYQAVKKMYGEHGYIQYGAEFQPKFRTNAADGEGIVELLVTIDEGHIFKVRSINFEGNGEVAVDSLLREMLLRPGDVFNQQLFEDSVRKLNQTGLFETIDHDKDVDYRTDRKSPLVDLTIHLKRKKS